MQARKVFRRRHGVAAGLTLALLLAVPGAMAQEPALENDEQKTLYALGLALSQQLRSLGFTADEVNYISAGFNDGLLGSEGRVELQTWGPRLDSYLQQRSVARAGEEKEASAAFLQATAAEEGAGVTQSGLIYFDTSPGDGPVPEAVASVQIEYVGKFRDGTVFDQSAPGEYETIKLDATLPCLAEGIGRMQIGGKSRFVCPPSLAYGDQGAPPFIPPNAALVFEVTLIGYAPEAPLIPEGESP